MIGTHHILAYIDVSLIDKDSLIDRQTIERNLGVL